MPKRSAPVDVVFHALADPTRRAVIERLGRGPAPTRELARHFDMALPSFAQHLDVLTRGGLVTSHKQGRVRTYHLVPAQLEVAKDWMEAQRAVWEQRSDQFDSYVTEPEAGP